MSDRVTFVSYDGEAQNFCRGCFVCEIDGVEYAFGGEHCDDDYSFSSFWDRDYDWGCGEWGFYEEKFPEELMEYFDEVVECSMENVPDLDCCCDGCR